MQCSLLLSFRQCPSTNPTSSVNLHPLVWPPNSGQTLPTHLPLDRLLSVGLLRVWIPHFQCGHLWFGYSALPPPYTRDLNKSSPAPPWLHASFLVPLSFPSSVLLPVLQGQGRFRCLPLLRGTELGTSVAPCSGLLPGFLQLVLSSDHLRDGPLPSQLLLIPITGARGGPRYCLHWCFPNLFPSRALVPSNWVNCLVLCHGVTFTPSRIWGPPLFLRKCPMK